MSFYLSDTFDRIYFIIVLKRKFYRNSLKLARENDIHSIAFPAISTGVYGYPLEEAAPIAMEAIREWLKENEDYEMRVILSCFNQRTYELYERLMENYV